MNLNNDKIKKNPSQEEKDLILKFFTSKKLVEAKKRTEEICDFEKCVKSHFPG